MVRPRGRRCPLLPGISDLPGTRDWRPRRFTAGTGLLTVNSSPDLARAVIVPSQDIAWLPGMTAREIEDKIAEQAASAPLWPREREL